MEKLKFKLQNNVPLSPLGRKDMPRRTEWKFWNFPIHKMKVGQSFIAVDNYEYGRTIAIKNKCRRLAASLNIKMSFAVREWRGKTRVWRVK